MFPYIETENGFQTLVDNKSYSVETSHSHYDEVYEAVVEGDVDKFMELFSKESLVNKTFEGTSISVKDGVVYYGDEAVHNVVTDKIISLSDKGLDPQPMINFLSNLMKNPSSRAVNELYSFLAHKKLPITEDGCFIAYKCVRSSFKDKYSGTLDNSIGAVIEVRRNQVDEDSNKHCSHGLHVGALEYAGPGGWYNNPGDKTLIVKVNPADAVSVPADHDFTKLRVCKYEVISEYKAELDDDYYPAPPPFKKATVKQEDILDDEDKCPDCGEEQSWCECCIDCGENQDNCYCDEW